MRAIEGTAGAGFVIADVTDARIGRANSRRNIVGVMVVV